MTQILKALPFFLFSILSTGQIDKDFYGETITLKATDGIEVSADLYMTQDSKAPLILLFHQAGYSRGEYREIAPKLNQMGFNCLAIDQRSGKQVNGVVNQTNVKALDAGKGTEYIDALADLEAAYLYAKHGMKPQKVIIWGSSYSASLALYLGSVHHKNLAGVIAFAPGEYFKVNGKSIESHASKITAPVFITSAKSEYEQWKDIYQAINSDKAYYLPENEGKHGSKALWNDNPGHEAYWATLEKFLLKL